MSRKTENVLSYVAIGGSVVGVLAIIMLILKLAGVI